MNLLGLLSKALMFLFALLVCLPSQPKTQAAPPMHTMTFCLLGECVLQSSKEEQFRTATSTGTFARCLVFQYLLIWTNSLGLGQGCGGMQRSALCLSKSWLQGVERLLVRYRLAMIHSDTGNDNTIMKNQKFTLRQRLLRVSQRIEGYRNILDRLGYLMSPGTYLMLSIGNC